MQAKGNVSRRVFLSGSAGAVASASVPGVVRGRSGNSETQADRLGPAGMPYAQIGSVRISRLMLGGNLIAGAMHARDLIYVRQLFKAYNTVERMLDTFRLAESLGINTVLESGAELVARYNKERGGHMQIIPSVHPALGKPDKAVKEEVRRKVDAGCAALYVWGAAGDKLVRAKALDKIGYALDCIKAAGLPAGVGGHSLEVPKACEAHKLPVDFYVKTLHRDDYPSATPKHLRKDYIWLDGGPGWYDNMWCINPEETIDFMGQVKKPWIAFKVLAAGAIHPRQGFAHAFDNGADIIAVGMFDFQVKENCELTKRVVRRARDRARPWYA